eukprot:366319-Chlamydomonas_euryale.AAC.15
MYMQASARNNTSACKHAHASIRMQAPACASTGGAHTAATLARPQVVHTRRPHLRVPLGNQPASQKERQHA